MCADFAQMGQLVVLDNAAFRAIKAVTPGPYTFILQASEEVPRRLAHPKKKTVGVRIPGHPVVQALLRELGEPMVSSTLLMPDAEDPMTDGWQIKEALDHQVEAVIDAGECGVEPARSSTGPPATRRSSASASATPPASSEGPPTACALFER